MIFSKPAAEELGERKIPRILERVIKAKYDQEVDVLSSRFSSAPIDESDEEMCRIVREVLTRSG